MPLTHSAPSPSLSSALALLLTLTCSPALAIVDVHEDYYTNLDVDQFSAFMFNFDGTAGTSESMDFEFENHSVMRRGQTTLMFIGALNFAETNKVESQNDQFAHLRYVRNVSGRHGFDLLAQFQKDEFKLVDSRVVYGGGYRYEWQRGPGDQRGLLGIGAIRERETYVDRVAEQDLWRANIYASVGRDLAPIPGSWLTLSAYVQPAFTDTGDTRAIAILGLSAPLTRNLAVELSVDYSHDSDPEPGLDTTNWGYSTGITWTFR